MIDPAMFWPWWVRICARFNREPDPQMAQDYLAYIEDAGLDADELMAACAAVWATREFFPRPADFLTVQASAGWIAALRWATEWSATIDPARARELTARLDARTKRALEAIGGIDALREGKGNTPRVRATFFEAFERTLLEDAQERAIAARSARPALGPGAGYIQSVEVADVRVGAGERVRVSLDGSAP